VPSSTAARWDLGLRAGAVVCLNFNVVVVHGKPGTIVPLLIRTLAEADLAVKGHAFARVARESSMESAGVTVCRVGGSKFASGHRRQHLGAQDHDWGCWLGVDRGLCVRA